MKRIQLFALFGLLSWTAVATQNLNYPQRLDEMTGLFDILYEYEQQKPNETDWTKVDLKEQTHAIEYIVSTHCKNRAVHARVLAISPVEPYRFMLHFIQHFSWENDQMDKVRMQVFSPKHVLRYTADGQMHTSTEDAIWTQNNVMAEAPKPVRDTNDESYDLLLRHHRYIKTAQGFIDHPDNTKHLNGQLVCTERGDHVYTRINNPDF